MNNKEVDKLINEVSEIILLYISKNKGEQSNIQVTNVHSNFKEKFC